MKLELEITEELANELEGNAAASLTTVSTIAEIALANYIIAGKKPTRSESKIVDWLAPILVPIFRSLSSQFESELTKKNNHNE